MSSVGNSFGTLFRITTFGESHGTALGVVIDGCPPGFPIDLNKIQYELDRRKPGQSKLVSPRKEEDKLEVLSGLFEGKTTGAPVTFQIINGDVRSKDYSEIKDKFRPGHADWPYYVKYGHRDYRGGGRSSVRETVGKVIGGAVARQSLSLLGVEIYGGVVQIGKVKAQQFVREAVEQNEVRSADPNVVEAMIAEIETSRKARDSIGGVIEIRADNVPIGLGEPVFSKLDAAIAYAMMSIQAVKGVEIGAGFRSAELRGSEMSDPLTPTGFRTNNHGGTLGGISSGAPIVVRFAVKPTSSIPQALETINTKMEPDTITTLGRHDPCVAIRAVPIGEAMLALVLLDYWLMDEAQQASERLFNERVRPKFLSQ